MTGMAARIQDTKHHKLFQPEAAAIAETAKPDWAPTKCIPNGHAAAGDHGHGRAAFEKSILPDSLTIHENITARVHYDGSGATYRNTVGMYVYDDKGNITSTKILFADASYKGLVGGSTDFNLSLKHGDHIGFFIAPNAAVQGDTAALIKQGGNFHMVYAANGAPANALAGQPMQLAYQAPNGTWSNVHTQFWTELYTTNTSSNADGFQHAKVSTDAKTGQMHVMFEDMQGGGNKDFRDGNFTIDIGSNNVKHLTNPFVSQDSDGHHGHGFDPLAHMSTQHHHQEHWNMFS
jgi:hypothetical protein